MADSSNGFQVPWASLAVVATLVSGTLLTPTAFDLLRPAEKERAQALSGSLFEVDARLWEDPFSAARRHESERRQRCEKEERDAREAKRLPNRECDANALALRRDPAQLRKRLDPDGNRKLDNVLVLAVLVPGNPFVGAEESRRRTRYAVHAGLEAERYLPESVDQLGLLSVDVTEVLPARPSRPEKACDAKSGDPRPGDATPVDQTPQTPKGSDDPCTGGSDRMLVPYELLSERRYLSRKGRTQVRDGQRTVVVLWIDESALPWHKLDGLAHVLDAVVPECKACLHLIGPSSSDGLRSALVRLDELASPPRPPLEPSVGRGLRLIADAKMFNTSATLDDELLEPTKDQGAASVGIQNFVRAKLAAILDLQHAPGFAYKRAIGSDKQMMAALADELHQRLGTASRQRVVTIVESDPLFSRPYEEELRHKLESVALGRRPDDRIFFYRGIDGMTARDGAARDHAPKPGGDGKSAADARLGVEWPESRDQLDYIRRMAAELRRSEAVPYTRDGRTWASEPIGAIGILAGDVHDKLLLLQALHESFPDKVFFASDMDARLLHPRTLPFTRNLIVASSLPLQFPMASVKLEGTEQRPTQPRQLHAGIAPLRDAFQASAYAAVRVAACARQCGDVTKQLDSALENPSIYEIGRSGAVPLGGLDYVERRAKESTRVNVAVLGIGTLLIVLALAVWPSTPALKIARESTLAGSADMTMGMAMSSLLAAIYAMVLGLWTGSVVEALWPGTLGVAGVRCWAAVAAGIALLVYPGLGLNPAAAGAATRAVIALATVLLLWVAWSQIGGATPARPDALPADTPVGEPLVWLEGISGWPSHFINILAILVGVFALDRSWAYARKAHDAEHVWLGFEQAGDDAPRAGPSSTGPSPGPGARTRVAASKPWLFEWVYQRGLTSWKIDAEEKPVDVTSLWREFRLRAGPDARAWRIALWYVLTVAVVVAMFAALHEHALPKVPVRGQEHRTLITATMLAALALLPLVIVAMADATRLTRQLIIGLSNGRSIYPVSTVRRFAAKLGSAHQHMWCHVLDAQPCLRSAAPPIADEAPSNPPDPGVPGHTLLDDWIDIRLIARHTDAVTPLVVAPFAMLTLVVVARSRLFDNWALTWPIAFVAALCVVWLGLLTVSLKLSAERMRASALDRMNADLRWLQGSSPEWKKLIDPMKQMLEWVERERRGAFAAPFDQWFFKALLVPLGGAGGAQLVERLLMAR